MHQLISMTHISIQGLVGSQNNYTETMQLQCKCKPTITIINSRYIKVVRV